MIMPIHGIGAILIDMNGNVVKHWKDSVVSQTNCCRVSGHLGTRDVKHAYQDQTDLVQVDWEGKAVWKFDKKEYIEDPEMNHNGWLVNTMIIKEKVIL